MEAIFHLTQAAGGNNTMSALQNMLHGAATVFQLFPETPRHPPLYTPPPSDSHALRGDFEAVGNDLWVAIRAQSDDEEENRPSS